MWNPYPESDSHSDWVLRKNQAADNINSTAITTLSNMAVSKARIMASKG